MQPECRTCRWWRYRWSGVVMEQFCELGKKLEWCSQYEREPGSDDLETRYTDDTQIQVIDND